MNLKKNPVFDLLCRGALLCTEEQKKIFEILANRSLDSVTPDDLKEYDKNAKLWEILYNVKNEDLVIKPDGTIDKSNYKEIDAQKFIQDQLDDLFKAMPTNFS